MEELTLRRFIFNEVMSVKLVEKSDAQSTKWFVIVSTLDDEEDEDNLVFEKQFADKESALTALQYKYSCLLGLVEWKLQNNNI